MRLFAAVFREQSTQHEPSTVIELSARPHYLAAVIRSEVSMIKYAQHTFGLVSIGLILSACGSDGSAPSGEPGSGGDANGGGTVDVGGSSNTGASSNGGGGSNSNAGAPAGGTANNGKAGAPSGGHGNTSGGTTAGGSMNSGGSPAGGGGGTNAGGSAGHPGNGTGCPSTNAVTGWATESGGTTGGGTLTPTPVTSLSALNNAAKGNNAAVIQISGTITGDVTVGSNKTFIGGCGGKATIKGHIQLTGSKNVIFRNLFIVGNNCTDSPSDCSAGADAVTVQSSNHVWFDHCDVSDGSDGNLDVTHGSDFVTISWTKFHYSGRRAGDHQFCNLIGHSDSNGGEDAGHLKVTFDHVWWADNVDQRMPRVRFGQVHVLNSLYTAAGDSACIEVGVSCNIRSEGNVFQGVSDAVDSTHKDSASIIQSIGNQGSSTNIGSAAFTPPYTYQAIPAADVPAIVKAGAGPK